MSTTRDRRGHAAMAGKVHCAAYLLSCIPCPPPNTTTPAVSTSTSVYGTPDPYLTPTSAKPRGGGSVDSVGFLTPKVKDGDGASGGGGVRAAGDSGQSDLVMGSSSGEGGADVDWSEFV
jgi:hypothetical protein